MVNLIDEHPPPIGAFGQKNPNRFAHCAGDMDDGCVNGDHQIEIGHQRRGVGEILQLPCPIGQFHARRWIGGVGGAIALLQAAKPGVLGLCERGESCERGGSLAVIGMSGPPRPGDADFEADRRLGRGRAISPRRRGRDEYMEYGGGWSAA